MRTFDRGVEVTTASDYTLQRELEMTLDYIADMRRTSPGYPNPRYETVRAIVAEQERRKR